MGVPGVEAAEKTEPSGNGHVGRSLKRKEDPRLITGRATYVDDMVLPGMLYAAIVRSPEAHARILSIDTTAAKERPGVEAVFTGEDMAGMAAPCPMVWAPPGVDVHVPDHWPLARDKVGYVGQAVAVVLGPDKYAVVDAAEDVIVEYDPLPVVTDPEQALEDGAPVIHEEFGTNKVFEWSLPGGDVEGAFRDADVVVEKRIVNHRTAGAAIEPRAALAEWRQGKLTMWSSTQIPHIARVILSIQLGITEDKIRVVAPEVGGGFGSKLQVYGEEVLACWCAQRTEKPVKWTATRTEEMAVTHHGRDQIDYIRIGAKRDGTVTGIHAKIIQDCGSYHLIEGPVIPTFSACVIAGCYKFAAVQTDIVGVFTNKFTTDAIRGAGRPEATHMIELTMDALADELGMDRLELRRKNFITEFPYELPHGFIYDSGNYDGTLDRCLEKLDLDAFRAEQEELRGRGVYRGVGFSTYVEICGLGPSRALGPQGWGMQGGYFESAQVRVHPTGSVTVYTGTSPHGQGHETGVRPDRRRPARRRPGGRRRDPRRHEHGPVRQEHVRLAVARRRRRGDRARGREGAGQGEADRRAPAGGRSRGHRAGRRQLPRGGLARQGDDARGGGGGGLHPAGPARGHGGRARRDLVLRPDELRLAVRRARVHQRGRRRDRAAWTSSATSRSTTAALRSTRC